MTKEEAILILEEVKMFDDSMYQYNQSYMDALNMAIEALQTATIHMTGQSELIRCKDCKYFNGNDDWCDYYRHVYNEDYCSAAVHVVRCKNCTHWINGYCTGIPFSCDDSSYIETNENDYCDYAERKEE